MYTPSQFLALSSAILLCIIAIFYADTLSQWLPSTSPQFSIQEQQQLYDTFTFHSKKNKNELSQISIRPPRIAFCCSADLDVSVRAVELMSHIHASSSQSSILPQHHEHIESIQALLESFLFYFSQGAAAEQAMSSAQEFKKIVHLAMNLHLQDEQARGPTYRPAPPPQPARHNVGGNAATMAERAAVEGCDVLLGAAIGRHMYKHLAHHSNLQLIGHLKDEDHEDVHLVLEYASGDIFANHRTPRANRYYLNHDIYNAQLTVLEQFEEALLEFQPDIIVIGGLQLMEGDQDTIRRADRVHTLGRILQQQILPSLFVDQLKDSGTHKPPRIVHTHYEFAAVSEFSLFSEIIELVLPYATSIGLNEQELAILHSFITTGEQVEAVSSRPSVETVTRQIHELLKTVLSMEDVDDNRTEEDPAYLGPLAHLSRIHFHTLQFHIICQKTGSTWEDPTTSLIESALMSSKLACGKTLESENNQDTEDDIEAGPRMQRSSELDVDVEKVEVLLERYIQIYYDSNSPVEKRTIDPLSPIVEWTDSNGFQCYLVPMLACKVPDHTAGLGDNISGTGMAYHHHHNNI